MRKIWGSALLLLVAGLVLAQDNPFSAITNVTAIEVTVEVVDDNGRTPSDLKPSDFAIFEDGVERSVVAVEYLCPGCSGGQAIVPVEPAPEGQAGLPVLHHGPWDILIYIDYELSARTTIRDAVRTLTAEAERLTKQGRVEVVVSDPTPRRLLAPTTDAKAVAEALTVASKISAQSRLANVRRAFILSNVDGKGTDEESYAKFGNARSSIVEETALVRTFIGRLSTWVGGYPRRSPQALFLVADGFDVTPSDFYAETLHPNIPQDRRGRERVQGGTASPRDLRRAANARDAKRESKLLASESRFAEVGRAYHPLARQLAAAGWTVMSMRGGLNAEIASEAAMGSGNSVVANFMSGNGNTGLPTRGLQLRPVEALATFADATGGGLVADTTKFGSMIDALANRVTLTYQVSRPVDGLVRQIDIRPRREGLTVHGARYASSSTPELVATSRASSLIDGVPLQGDLPVTAKLQFEQGSRKESPKGMLEARAGLAAIAPVRAQLKNASVRVTIGVAAGNEQPRIIHQLHNDFDLSQLQEAIFTSPVQLPKNVDKVAVVIEELATGAWGGAVLPVPKNQEVITTAGWTESSSGAPMAWVAWDAALAQAQQEKKLIVQCSGCDEKLFADSTLRNTLAAFVLTRNDGTQPRLLVLDPWGRTRLDWTPANAAETSGRLRQVLPHAGAFLHAGSLGDTPEGHLALGFTYLKLQAFDASQKEYELAESTARAKGDNALAQRAQIQGAAALAQSGKRDAAVSSLEKILKTPQSSSTEAEAWLILGHLRKAAGNARSANDAYVKAAERAPQGSELQKVATKLAGGA
jgi:tetratricopeptide (TPR) repeat protein